MNVPLFMVDEDTSFSGLLKQAAAYGTGGWWLGGAHMKINSCAPSLRASRPPPVAAAAAR